MVEGVTEAGDITPPTVVSTAPAEGAEGVSMTAPLTVTFSEPVALLGDSTVVLELTAGGWKVSGFVERTAAALLTFSTAYPLDPGAAHESEVAGWAVTDTAGNPMAAPHEWTFRTGGTELPVLEAGRLLEHVGVLAHDSMMGRDAGSPEELAAARYVRGRFRELGLEPGAPDYFQTFPLPGSAGDVESRNVVGVLPGRGELADEWLVVGAHYDHVGVVDGEIHNGADDNASGTAVMLELARAVAGHAAAGGLGEEPRRSVMFHAYGAEEMGLVGSRHYCGNPTVPVSSIVGMLNLDMVGRLRNRQLKVIGPGLDTPLGRLFPHANRTSLTLIFDPSLVDRSDQSCFLDLGVPAAFLHTGLHAYYHKPGEDVEIVHEEGMTEVGDLALRALVKWMLAPEPLEEE